jgi:probable nitrogen fixation protein
MSETPVEPRTIPSWRPISSRKWSNRCARIDSYGSYDGWTVERILEPYIVTKEMRRQIPVIGDPDEQTLARVKAFYNGIAVLIEKECGLMAVPMVNITHEGFGRALITVGKLVVMDRRCATSIATATTTSRR